MARFLPFGILFLDHLLKPVHLLAQLSKRELCGIGFLSAFLGGAEIRFSVPFFSYLRHSLILCMVYAPPCFLQRLQCFSVQAFLWIFPLDLVPGFLFHFLPLWEAFLLDCVLNLSWAYKHSITMRDKRSKHMSMDFIPFLWSLNWSCHECGHIQRM